MFLKLNDPLILANSFPKWLIPVLIVAGIVLVNVINFIIFKIVKSRQKVEIDQNQWIEALGGKPNILSIQAVGSRLSVALKDKELMDRENLTRLGVVSILVMTSKITFVLEGKAMIVAEALISELDKKE